MEMGSGQIVTIVVFLTLRLRAEKQSSDAGIPYGQIHSAEGEVGAHYF